MDWFESYLSDRNQRVHFRYGDPQESILGPVLFTIHMNDLLIPVHFKSTCYVDDEQFYLSFSLVSLANAIKKLNEDLRSMLTKHRSS